MRERQYEGVHGAFGVQNYPKILKEHCKKKKTAVFSQADQRENRRFFGL